jgi:hypothetical protein
VHLQQIAASMISNFAPLSHLKWLSGIYTSGFVLQNDAAEADSDFEQGLML